MLQEIKRLFIAIELSTQMKDAIHSLDEKLRAADPRSSVRWVSYGDMHVTLKFLGETPVGRIASVESAMKSAAEGRSTFRLSLYGSGVFPNERRPAVFWVGVNDDGSLSDLANSIRKECSKQGFAEETNAFAPHITIGRARDRADARDLTKIASLLKSGGVRNESQIIDHISLIHSQLTPKGPIYTNVFTVPLR